MAFFAIVCALLIEQVYPLPLHNPVYQAYRKLADWAARNLAAGRPGHGWLAWSAAVGAPAVLVAVVYGLLHEAGWLLGWLWSVAVLFVTLGFRQFSHHVTAIRDALDMGDEILARQLLAQWKSVDTATLPRSGMLRQVLEYAVLDAHRHVFGVLVAFLIGAAFGLGPAGAVLFRAAEYVARYWREQRGLPDSPVAGDLPDKAQIAWYWINWLPARATAASFAAAGNFEQAVDNWRQANTPPGVTVAHTDAEAVVLAAAMGAVDLSWPLALDEQGKLARLPASAAGGDNSGASESGVETWEAAAAGQAVSAAGRSLGMQHLQLLVGLVWRAILMWGGVIALVGFTSWVS